MQRTKKTLAKKKRPWWRSSCKTYNLINVLYAHSVAKKKKERKLQPSSMDQHFQGDIDFDWLYAIE